MQLGLWPAADVCWAGSLDVQGTDDAAQLQQELRDEAAGRGATEPPGNGTATSRRLRHRADVRPSSATNPPSPLTTSRAESEVCRDAGLQVSDTAPLRCVLMRLSTLAEVWVASERLNHAMWQVKGCRSGRRSRRRMMRRTAAPPSPRLAAQARTPRPSRFPTDAEGLCHQLLVGGRSDTLRDISCY